MTIDDNIRDEKLQYNINKEAAKISALLSGKIDKYEYLTGEEILSSNQRQIIERAKFTYSPLSKAFEKQIKIIEDQGEKQIKALQDHGKQLVNSSSEKESLTLSKQKEIFEELANKRIDEIQNLSKQTDFNNLTYYSKGKSAQKYFVGFKGPLGFYKNMKEGDIKLEKAEEKQKEFKSDLNEISKRRYKPENEKSSIKNIKTLYKSREKVTKLFDNYSGIASEAKYGTKYGEGLKILTPKHMLQRIAPTQVKAGNTSENLLNEIRQIIYSLYRAKEITKRVYNNIMNSIKL